MQKEDSILRQILELGRLSGDISSNKVVKVKSESFKTNRRPSFTNAEWKEVLKASRYRSSEERLWENKKDKSKNTDYINGATLNQRKLLHEFINFMVGSGLRTTEAMNLKWSDITYNEIVEEVNGKFQSVESCKISVSGKSKKRKCDPQPFVKEILERVKVRQFEFSRENGFKFAAKKEYVWSDQHGNKIDRFNKSFTKLLESCDLLYDDHGEKRVIGSLRHTYGTFRKNLGEVDSYELAIQMGTSPEMINKHYVHSDDYDRSTAVTRVKKSENPGAKKKKKVK
jgi:integrase